MHIKNLKFRTCNLQVIIEPNSRGRWFNDKRVGVGTGIALWNLLQWGKRHDLDNTEHGGSDIIDRASVEVSFDESSNQDPS